MYCPQCGTEVADNADRCPNGHVLRTRPAEVVGRTGEVARRLVSLLGASAPLPAEVRVVVVGLKILSLLSALFTILGWWRVASFLAQLGMGGGGPLVGLAIGLTWSLVVYAVALLVQMAAPKE